MKTVPTKGTLKFEARLARSRRGSQKKRVSHPPQHSHPHNFKSKILMENGASSGSSDPSSFLTEIIGAPVKVKLNSSVEYRGRDFSLEMAELYTKTPHLQDISCPWTVI